MSIYRKIMDSKVMDIVEILGDICIEIAKATTEVLIETFNHPCENKYSCEKLDIEQATYDYWINLSFVDQQYYFEHNETLQFYGENYRYDDKYQMAKSAAYIAKCTGRAFTDKYDKY